MRNPFGTVSKCNKEWGPTARKHEDHDRGFRRTALQDALEEFQQETTEDTNE